jgi:hypothetical protein
MATDGVKAGEEFDAEATSRRARYDTARREVATGVLPSIILVQDRGPESVDKAVTLAVTYADALLEKLGIDR